MQAVELFRVAGKLFLDKTEYDKDLADADKSGKSFSENLSLYMEKAKKVLLGIGIAAGVKKIATDIWELSKATASAGDKIDKQSQALGLSRKAYQEWDYILSQSGASIDGLGISMKTMNAAISANSAETAAGLSRLGLSAAHLQSLSPEKQFEAIVRAFQKMPAGSQKSALAMQLLGKNAQSLMPLLNSSTDSIDELRENAERLGLIMSDDDVNASVAFSDALDDLNRTWTGLKQRLGAQFLPMLTNGLKGVASFVGRISTSLSQAFATGDWSGFVSALWESVKGLIEKVADKAKTIIKDVFGFDIPDIDLSFIQNAFQWFVDHKETVVTAITAILAAFAIGELVTFLANLNPVVTAFELLAVGIASVATNWGDIKEWIGQKWETTISWAQEKWEIVNNAFIRAGQWVGKKWTTTVEWVQNKWNDVKDAFATAKEWVGEKAHNISVAWTSSVDDWFNTITGWIDKNPSLPMEIKGAANDLLAWVKGWIDGSKIKNVALSVKAGVDDWLETIKKWISGDKEVSFSTVISASVDGWLKIIKAWLDAKVGPSFTLNIGAKVSEWIERIWDWVQHGVSATVNFFGNLFGGGNNEPYTGPMSDKYYGGSNRMGGGHMSNEPVQMEHAKGLNYVPWDGYRAVLHRGETVLNQAQGREWRQNNSGGNVNAEQLYNVVAQAVASAVENIQINMDGKSVGNAVTQQVSRNIYQQQFGRRFAAV